MYFRQIDLSGLHRKYSENNPNKIYLDDEKIDRIITMLHSDLKEDRVIALDIIKRCNNDIKYFQLMEILERKYKWTRKNKDRGGTIYKW